MRVLRGVGYVCVGRLFVVTGKLSRCWVRSLSVGELVVGRKVGCGIVSVSCRTIGIRVGWRGVGESISWF